MIWEFLKFLARLLMILFVSIVCLLIFLPYDTKVFKGWAWQEVVDIMKNGLVP